MTVFIYHVRPVMVWLFTLPFFLCACGFKGDAIGDYGIIPMPNQISPGKGEYVVQGEVTVFVPAEEKAEQVFDYLGHALEKLHVDVTLTSSAQCADILFLIEDSLQHEAYRLDISPQSIQIMSSSSCAGLFYGVQTLLRLFPWEAFESVTKHLSTFRLPVLTIVDKPRFAYRGAMMDVARNFLPKEQVLKFLDLMALYKMNTLHLHLTDDQGWRVEISKYPLLTQIGAYREQTQVGHSDYYFPRRYNGKEHQGYYTKEDISQIVKYANERFITVIPEIEMPGHASAALASYPYLSCGLEKEYVVRDYFDVFDQVFCPKDSTFIFLEDVLTEIMELFPSHYIHIGGDECPKKAWDKCAHCKALLQQEGLTNWDALQSYFVTRIERFVNGKGRDIIGWDEILEGGLSPNATVMSWRGENGGLEAARQGHKVIMTPNNKCYLDYYQEDPDFAPLAIGGFLPLDSVYLYEPVPSRVSSQEQAFILGTQANIWGEYIQDGKGFEYMAFPRLIALSETQWTNPDRKDLQSFMIRLDKEFSLLDALGVNACRNFYQVNFSGTWNNSLNTYQVGLSTFCPNSTIRYAINDTVKAAFENYEKPITISGNDTVFAYLYRDNKVLGKMTFKSFTVNKATGKPCAVKTGSAGSEVYTALTDGVRGSTNHLKPWAMFNGDTLRIYIDLQAPTSVEKLDLAFLWRPHNCVWPPSSCSVYALSSQGDYEPLVDKKALCYDFSSLECTRFPFSCEFDKPAVTQSICMELHGWNLKQDNPYDYPEPCCIAIDEIELY